MEAFLDPNEILRRVKLQSNMVAADFGCGSGGWVIPLAEKLSSGKVYAIDILEEPLSVLRTKMRMGNILNIQILKVDAEEGVKEIKDQSCDLVLMSNFLFQSEKKDQVLAEGKRVLKPEGRMLIVDWQEHSPIGPQEGRVSLEKVKKMAEKLAFKVQEDFTAGPYHYGLILTKS